MILTPYLENILEDNSSVEDNEIELRIIACYSVGFYIYACLGELPNVSDTQILFLGFVLLQTEEN